MAPPRSRPEAPRTRVREAHRGGGQNGDIKLIRSHGIRLAALRFAFEGSVEAHQQLSAFCFAEQAHDGDLRSILAIVEERGMRNDTVLGVVNPSPDDAKEFIFHVSAFVYALKSGAQLVPGAVPRVRAPS